jgi:hypothetical protein
MGGVDEVWHARNGGDTFLNEQRQKLIILAVGIGRGCRPERNTKGNSANDDRFHGDCPFDSFCQKVSLR